MSCFRWLGADARVATGAMVLNTKYKPCVMSGRGGWLRPLSRLTGQIALLDRLARADAGWTSGVFSTLMAPVTPH